MNLDPDADHNEESIVIKEEDIEGGDMYYGTDVKKKTSGVIHGTGKENDPIDLTLD